MDQASISLAFLAPEKTPMKRRREIIVPASTSE
jgi:hypothetical protein